jgi:undecaprenyl-diphosphatase
MPWRRAGRFIRRQLSREEYLGLYLTIGLLISLLMLALVVAIARGFQGRSGVTRLDHEANLRLSEFRENTPELRLVLVITTQLGSVRVLTGLAVFVAILLLLRRRRLLAFVWLVGPAGGALLDTVLKVAFERERPPLRDPAINEMTMSFPSGHSMGSLVGYGLLAYLVVLTARPMWLRVSAVVGLSILVLAIGFSRVYLGAHYPSDVIGGYTVGGCWLAACICALELVRRRPRHPQT